MYTVLIADDEQNIREGLKYIVDWNRLGFRICGETANGEETLQFILRENPQLVLMDIRMPKMYGTDIIRKAREHDYSGRFIILSGYSDFTYAQTAIRYGADSYLTKPLDEDELSAVLQKIAANLNEEQQRSENIAHLQDKARNMILYETVTGSSVSRLTPADILSLNLHADIYQVVIYETYDTGAGHGGYSFAELLKTANKGNCNFDYFTEDNSEVILLKGQFALHKFQDFLDSYEKKPLQPDSPLDSLFLAYGRPVASLEDVHLSYREALTLKNRRFFCIQGQHTLGYQELPEHTEDRKMDRKVLDEYCGRLTGYLLSFNRGMVAETLFELEELLYHTDNISSVKLFLTDLYLDIKEKVTLTYTKAEIPFPSNAEAISHIGACRRLYEIIRYISELTETIINAAGSPSRSTVLDDIVYYIDHNYRNNIKLESIAPLFGYNSAYLGKIFNKHFGESFNSYVDNKRIEQSKELLKEKNLKVYEIAEAVGYKNVDYFHKKFKKYVGISPVEYRRNLDFQNESEK